MNPRAAINDLLPFQGSPFSLLGISPELLLADFMLRDQAERVGFEPTVPCGITGFQDQLLKPLGHLSKHRLASIASRERSVKQFLIFFLELFIYYIILKQIKMLLYSARPPPPSNPPVL